MSLTVLVLNILYDLRKALTGHCDHFYQKACCIDTVFSMDMTFYSQATGRLTANNGICLLHLCRNILKAYRHFITLLVKAFSHLVQHMGGSQISHCIASPALIFQKIIIQHN